MHCICLIYIKKCNAKLNAACKDKYFKQKSTFSLCIIREFHLAVIHSENHLLPNYIFLQFICLSTTCGFPFGLLGITLHLQCNAHNLTICFQYVLLYTTYFCKYTVQCACLQKNAIPVQVHS